MEPVTSSAHFSEDELKCKFTGQKGMNWDFMQKLEALRLEWGKPMHLSSAYRSSEHPAERAKSSPGYHHGKSAEGGGQAVDVLIDREDAVAFLKLALKYFNGIGINQKGEGRFIHLDDRSEPAMWSY